MISEIFCRGCISLIKIHEFVFASGFQHSVLDFRIAYMLICLYSVLLIYVHLCFSLGLLLAFAPISPSIHISTEILEPGALSMCQVMQK